MWSYELMPRYGSTLIVIYFNEESVGSLTFTDDKKEQIELWKQVITNLNQE